jgi:hypothetical protein
VTGLTRGPLLGIDDDAFKALELPEDEDLHWSRLVQTLRHQVGRKALGFLLIGWSARQAKWSITMNRQADPLSGATKKYPLLYTNDVFWEIGEQLTETELAQKAPATETDDVPMELADENARVRFDRGVYDLVLVASSLGNHLPPDRFIGRVNAVVVDGSIEDAPAIISSYKRDRRRTPCFLAHPLSTNLWIMFSEKPHLGQLKRCLRELHKTKHRSFELFLQSLMASGVSRDDLLNAVPKVRQSSVYEVAARMATDASLAL